MARHIGRILKTTPPALAKHLLLLEASRFGEFPSGCPDVSESLIGLSEQKAPRRVLRVRRHGALEVVSCGCGSSLFEQNASEQASRLGQVSLEGHRPLCVAARVGQ